MTLQLHESGMSPRTADDRPVHVTPWGHEKVMTRAEALAIASRYTSPNDWLGLMNLGTALYVLGESERGRATAARAAQLNPNSSTLLNLAVILEGYGEFDKSLALAEQAVKFDPTNQFAGLLWAQGLLRQGRWDEGWTPFCWYCWGRIWAEMEEYVPEWRGEPLNGKRILILQGGGFGDNLMFFRWIGEVKKLGAHVTYACPGDAREHPEHKTSGTMVDLLEGHPWVDRLIPTHEGPETGWLPEFDAKPSEYDYFVPIMALPKTFKTTIDTIPGREPYIFPRTKARPSVSKRLAVGLCWKAGEVLDPRRHRSLNDEQAKRLLSVDSIDWVSLQYKEEPPIRMACPNIDGWLQTARTIADLDLVVTVDSGVMHLAAAMGKPTWVLLPGLSDWKFLLNRDDSPFYPSLRIFRNEGLGLDSAIDKTRCALAEL